MPCFILLQCISPLCWPYPPEKPGVQLLLYIPGLGGGAYAAMYKFNVYSTQTFPTTVSWLWISCSNCSLLTQALNMRKEGYILGMVALNGFSNGIRGMLVQLPAIARKPKQLANVTAHSTVLPLARRNRCTGNHE